MNKIIKKTNEHIFLLITTFFLIAINVWNLLNSKPIYDEYDTASFFEFSLYPSFRMQIITIIYSTLKNYYLITSFQVLISILSYVYLVMQIKKYFDLEIVRNLTLVFLYILAFSSVVTEQNYILKSESLNNSALIFLFGTLFGYISKRSFSNFSKVVIAIVILSGTRAVSSLSALIILIIFVIIYNRKKIFEKKYLLMSLGALVFNAFFVFTATSTETSKIYTTSSIMNERLWVNPVWREEIIKGGFPMQSRNVWEASRNANTGLPPDQAVIVSAEFKKWWNQGNENFLFDFMERNLDYTIIGPLCLPCLYDDFTFRQTILSGWSQGTDEVRNNISLQKILTTKTFFWPERPEFAYIIVLVFFLFITFINVKLLWRPNEKDTETIKFVSLFFVYILSYSYISWWLGSKDNDMTRHQLNSALGIRVLIVFMVASQLDKLLKLLKMKS